jgi:hypothetical protein
MNPLKDNTGTLAKIREYLANLKDPSPYWRVQAAAWGILIVVAIAGGAVLALMTLSTIFGGGKVTFEAVGSPGPVSFSHYGHMWFQDGKYKDCKACHDKLFAPRKYGTFVFAMLKDSPPRKFRIGKNLTTLFVPGSARAGESALVTYKVPRACKTCATGQCHDGKESFSRFMCLSCHKRR